MFPRPVFQPSSVVAGTGFGACVLLSGDLTSQDYTTPAAIPFDTEQFDLTGFHDNVTNNTRLTVQFTGYVMLCATLAIDNYTIANGSSLVIRKNGSASYDGVAGQVSRQLAGNTPPPVFPLRKMCARASPISVVPGDYFEAYFTQVADTAVTIVAASTSFQIMVVT